MTERTVYHDEFATVTYDPDRKFLWYRRSAKSYPTLEDAAKSVANARSSLPPGTKLEHHVFLMDVREGPLRSDKDFEQVMRNSGPELSHLFKRSAVLVKTAVGKLQQMRIRSERGASSEIFDDEAKALAYLGVELARATG